MENSCLEKNQMEDSLIEKILLDFSWFSYNCTSLREMA